MAISSAMYAAVTGLSALGTGMQTISNNIANVNTVGFKAGRTNYEDLISQNYFSGGKVNQRGTGVRVSSIQSMFTQGSFMSSAQDTDMAITGEGFFSVRNAVTGAINYTRAGNFTMTKDGELEDPNGNILQGWQMSIPKPGQEAVRIGTPTDVKVTVLNAPPVASSLMKVVANLNAEDDPAYLYQQFELADVYAKSQAEPVAENARIETIAGIYPTTDSPKVSLIKAKYNDDGKLINTVASPAEVETSTDAIYDASFLRLFNERYDAAPPIQKVTDLKVVSVDKDEPKGALEPADITTAGDFERPAGTVLGKQQTVTSSLYDASFIEKFNSKFQPTTPLDPQKDISKIKVVTLTDTDKPPFTAGHNGDKLDPNTIDVSTHKNYTDSFMELYHNLIKPATGANDISNIKVFTPGNRGTVDTATGPTSVTGGTPNVTGGDDYEDSFLKLFNDTLAPTTRVAALSDIKVVSDADAAAANGNTGLNQGNYADGVINETLFNDLMSKALPYSDTDRTNGFITKDEYDKLMAQATPFTKAERADGYMTADEFTAINGDVSVISQAERTQGIMSEEEYNALLTDATGPIAVLKDTPVTEGATVLKETGVPGTINAPWHVNSPDSVYNHNLLEGYNAKLAGTAKYKGKVTDMMVVATGTPLTPDQRNLGYITEKEFTDACDYADNQEKPHSTGLGHYTNEDTYFYTELKPWPENENQTYNEYFSQYFIAQYNAYHPGAGITGMEQFKVVDDSSVLPSFGKAREMGFLTKSEFNSLRTSAQAEARAEATAKGRDAYNTLYNNIYNSTYDAITARLTDWQLEGNGFAGAWNAQDNPPIEPENYTYPQSLTIYDSLGAEHKLNVYYQPNPHMDNVWDYIITCDPIEDARKDSNNNLLMSDSASFSGLIQKGKITFSADGADRHGGEIKDIEAQNIDLEKCKMATIDPKTYDGSASTTMRNAKIGGYYKGSPTIDPYTGMQRTEEREYTVRWGGNVKGDPETSGMVWTDSLGNTGIIPVYDKQFAGPYSFGSGMTITFDTADLPLKFGEQDVDAVKVVAHSEQMAWTNLEPNKEGYFDFDVAFVQSASMALHPPYPEGMPTMIQNIALDMGAKNPYGLATNWELDDQSTTQYAAKSNTIFASSDGYPSGSLQRISIGTDGVLTGVFSNGRNQPLYQIGLTRFLNPWGLSKIGDNLFEETRYSGEGAMNEPGTAGNGTILANFLEQSNVDLSEEIVNMIVTQRGFQANSKTVTTTDTMLSEVIEMKR